MSHDPFTDDHDYLAPDAGDPAELLDDVQDFVGRFCVFRDDSCIIAVTLWAAHAHMVEHFHTTPRLALLSPEPASGKTRVLEILELLTPTPLFCLSASPAAIFRTLSKGPVTLLADEVDAIFLKRGKNDTNEDLRALLNAGYRRGASIPRCVGLRHDVQNFLVFCAVALAGLGDLPDTLMSRSIIIRMRRRAPGEPVEPFRHRQHAGAGHALRDRLEAWTGLAGEAAGEAWPDLPPGIEDRAAELWEPLLAIADAAGGPWPARARAACVALAAAALDEKMSLGIRLLADLRTIFGEADALGTSDILARLAAPEENGLEADAPWADLYGRPLGSRGLARMLGKYGVSSTKVWTGAARLQGYRRDALWDAWRRYLPPTPAEPEHVEHVEHPADLLAFRPATCSGSSPDVPEPRPHAEHSRTAEPRIDTGFGAAESGCSGNAEVGERACPECGGEGCAWCRPGIAGGRS